MGRGLDRLDRRTALVEPVETEPVETEPVETEPVEIEPTGPGRSTP